MNVIEQNNLAARSDWQGRIYSGEWIAGSGEEMAVFDKAGGEQLGAVGRADAADVRAAAELAAASQPAWAATPGTERAAILRKLARLVAENSDELARWLIRETGSIPAKAGWECMLTSEEILAAAEIATAPSGLVVPTTPGRRSFVERVPFGVVGIIAPWNAPLILTARALGPALAAGNAVLLKPDPQTPVIGGVLFAELLREAGLSPGLLHVLPGDAATGEAVVVDPRVEMVSFTGSTRGGRRVGALAGEGLKRVSLELGGNNAMVLLDDADVERAAAAASWGSFFFQGQICLATGRYLVHRGLAEEFTERLVARAEALAVGDPFTEAVDLGPMISERQAARAEAIVAETVAAGARLLCGGGADGAFLRPTVLADVRPGMRAFDEEVFAPVAPITAFDDEEEAVALVNQSDYGLTGAVISSHPDRALRLAEQMKSGIVHVNDQTLNHEVRATIGGMGISGNGARYGSPSNHEEFTQWRWITVREEIPAYEFPTQGRSK